MLTAMLALALQGHDCCASMQVLASDPSFKAAHLAPLALQWKPQFGKMATFRVGTKEARAFIVKPERKSQVGVIMIHEWWGLNDHIKREAERLHKATGYGVVALDLYRGKVTDNPEEAPKLMQAVDNTLARQTVKAASGMMRRGALLGKNVKRVGTVGYCFGGGWSLQAALLGGKDVSACVMYYGMPETDPAKLATLSAPVLGIFATKDQYFTQELVGRFEAAMKSAGKSLTLRNYVADHAFANPSNPNYDKVNADKAWGETLSFFKKYLRVQ